MSIWYYLNMILPTSIERIISFGGGFIINSSDYLPTTLERFATIAAISGAKITINVNSILLPTSMERIASFGKGNVIFNITKNHEK